MEASVKFPCEQGCRTHRFNRSVSGHVSPTLSGKRSARRIAANLGGTTEVFLIAFVLKPGTEAFSTVRNIWLYHRVVKAPVPPAGEMKLLLNFFSKKLRESRGQSPLALAAEAAPPARSARRGGGPSGEERPLRRRKALGRFQKMVFQDDLPELVSCLFRAVKGFNLVAISQKRLDEMQTLV